MVKLCSTFYSQQIIASFWCNIGQNFLECMLLQKQEQVCFICENNHLVKHASFTERNQAFNHIILYCFLPNCHYVWLRFLGRNVLQIQECLMYLTKTLQGRIKSLNTFSFSILVKFSQQYEIQVSKQYMPISISVAEQLDFYRAT